MPIDIGNGFFCTFSAFCVTIFLKQLCHCWVSFRSTTALGSITQASCTWRDDIASSIQLSRKVPQKGTLFSTFVYVYAISLLLLIKSVPFSRQWNCSTDILPQRPIKYIYLSSKLLVPDLLKQIVFKGRGPGINSSQSKNVGKIQLSMQLSHLSIIFENIWF